MAKEKKIKRPDTPLANSPEVEQKRMDVRTVVADINARSLERQTAVKESQDKLEAARLERGKNRKPLTSSRIYGLASFASSTGKQEKQE